MPRRASSAPSRPEIWVNCAASIDGRIALAGGARALLSSAEDLLRVHAMRADVDGVLVGVGTVIQDDPSLHVRWDALGRPPGREPTRIIVDGSGRTPEAARVLDGTIPTIVATSRQADRTFPRHVRTLKVGDRQIDLDEMWTALARLGMRRVLVEGGARILTSVLASGVFDRFSVYYAPVVIGGETAPSIVAGMAAATLEQTVGLDLDGVERVGEGYVATYRPRPRSAPSPPRDHP